LCPRRLVLETLEPLPGDRKCFRMINGVLVERTVKDVVPALQTNSDGLKKVLEDLVKQYNSKQQDMEKWKVCLRCPGCWAAGDQQTDKMIYRRKTTSRLFSNNGFTSEGEFWEQEGWQEIHIAFQSFPSLTELSSMLPG
jgi:hypothetical protein